MEPSLVARAVITAFRLKGSFKKHGIHSLTEYDRILNSFLEMRSLRLASLFAVRSHDKNHLQGRIARVHKVHAIATPVITNNVREDVQHTNSILAVAILDIQQINQVISIVRGSARFQLQSSHVVHVPVQRVGIIGLVTVASRLQIDLVGDGGDATRELAAPVHEELHSVVVLLLVVVAAEEHLPVVLLHVLGGQVVAGHDARHRGLAEAAVQRLGGFGTVLLVVRGVQADLGVHGGIVQPNLQRLVGVGNQTVLLEERELVVIVVRGVLLSDSPHSGLPSSTHRRP